MLRFSLVTLVLLLVFLATCDVQGLEIVVRANDEEDSWSDSEDYEEDYSQEDEDYSEEDEDDDSEDLHITVVGPDEKVPEVGTQEFLIWQTCHTVESSGKACPGAPNRTMYYHDTVHKKCKPFTFYGCGGNSNKFGTIQQFQRFCTVKPDGPCGQEKPQGTCRKQRFYFDWTQWQCLSYFGCPGGENNFSTRMECQQKCKDKLHVEKET